RMTVTRPSPNLFPYTTLFRSDGTAIKWFTDEFIQNHSNKVAAVLRDFKQNSPEGYQSNCAMVRDTDFRENLKEIDQPVLIVAGRSEEHTSELQSRENLVCRLL